MWRNPKLPGIVQPVTGRHTCDGPSQWPSCLPFSPRTLWRSVTPVTVRPARPSWRSETRFLAPISQKLKCFAMGLTTVGRGCDGTSCRSVTIYRESIFGTQFQFSKCHETTPPWQAVVTTTVRRDPRRLSQFFPVIHFAAQTTKQVVTIVTLRNLK